MAPVKAEGNIEDWLNQLLITHQKTINNTVKYAALDCETMAIDEFTHKYPSQVRARRPRRAACPQRPQGTLGHRHAWVTPCPCAAPFGRLR